MDAGSWRCPAASTTWRGDVIPLSLQSPWLLGAPPWKRRAFVKCGGAEVSMTNILAHANSGEVNEIFTQVLEGMGSNEIGKK